MHPNLINGEVCHLNDSVEKMQIFEVSTDEKDYRYILSSTCADGILYVEDIKALDNSGKDSVKISKKRKIAEVDKSKEVKKAFFAELE